MASSNATPSPSRRAGVHQHVEAGHKGRHVAAKSRHMHLCVKTARSDRAPQAALKRAAAEAQDPKLWMPPHELRYARQQDVVALALDELCANTDDERVTG